MTAHCIIDDLANCPDWKKRKANYPGNALSIMAMGTINVAGERLNSVVAFLRKSSAAGEVAPATDSALIQRFVQEREERAFAELIERHGPLVWSVCRRILPQSHDAEDAFQATFLILLQKAHSIVRRGSIKSWLYGVAYRVALRAKGGLRRQPACLVSLADIPAPDAEPEVMWRDLRCVLDAEIQQLTKKDRLALILCDLEGKTHQEAARYLGCPRSTIATRLRRARGKLRRRLARRGMVLSVGGMAEMALSNARGDCLPPGLMEATVRLGTNLAFPASAAVLAQKVIQAMMWTKLKTALGIGLTFMALAGLSIFAFSNSGPHATSQQPLTLVASAAAPVRSPEDALARQVRNAIERGVKYLKEQQKDGGWDYLLPTSSPGGATSLALLALLEAGVKPDDPAIVGGLNYLRRIEPEHTYVVSLQTQVFCRADPQKLHRLIQRNVDWLVQARILDRARRPAGWSYKKGLGDLCDNSNSHFAVLALHVANDAGAKIDPKIWHEIQRYYLQNQAQGRGWGYAPHLVAPTLTMTLGGLSSLLITAKHLPKNLEGYDQALNSAMSLVGDQFTVKYAHAKYYCLHAMVRAGRLAGKKTFVGKDKERVHDWYLEGAREIVSAQLENGSWPCEGQDFWPVVSTGFALMFLSQGR
jgi:RNA polymerase sigma factor (sigma-70 family)